MLNSAGTVWIEAGQADGYPVTNGNRYFYWADDRTGYAYAEQNDTSDAGPTNGTNYISDGIRRYDDDEFLRILGSLFWHLYKLADELQLHAP